MKLLRFLALLWIIIVITGVISPTKASLIMQLLSTYIRIGLDYAYIWTVSIILAIKGQ
jgi:hypothetical protein